MKKLLLLTSALFFFCANVNAQITITDTGHCSYTTLSATLLGETPINAGITADDTYSPLVPIGFTFSFYGTNYTQLVIGENGNICFTASEAGAFDPYAISAALLGNTSMYNCICGPWCDIDQYYTGSVVGSITYATVGTAPNRKLVITWCGCSMYSCSSQLTTSQIILYETTNVAEVHITNKQVCSGWNGGYAIVGLENATGTAATVAPGRDYPSVWTGTDEAWRFTPAGTTTYSVSSIPYSPMPNVGSTIDWYNTSTGTLIGTGATITVSPSVTTTYEATATGCSDTARTYITVSPGTASPIMGNPEICVHDTTFLTDASSGGTWSSSNTSVAYVLGSYGIGAASNIRIYPNPATSVLSIDASVKVNATILSIDGRMVIEQKDATTIDVSMLPNALYIIMVYDENNLLLMTSKFVKTDQ